MKKIVLPEKLCISTNEEYCVVDVKLDSNIIIRNLLLHQGKFLQGEVVGGQDGVIDYDFNFESNSIKDIKRQKAITSNPMIKSIKNKFNIL